VNFLEEFEKREREGAGYNRRPQQYFSTEINAQEYRKELVIRWPSFCETPPMLYIADEQTGEEFYRKRLEMHNNGQPLMFALPPNRELLYRSRQMYCIQSELRTSSDRIELRLLDDRHYSEIEPQFHYGNLHINTSAGSVAVIRSSDEVW